MNSQSLSMRIYEYLLDKIFSNEIRPGEFLNRREVADEIGVSVAPVLKAMLILEAEGFLETIPRKGTRIRLIQPGELHEQLIVREALECQATRMFCGEPVVQNKNQLIKLAEAVDRTRPGTKENWKTEIEFHKALIKLADCHALLKEFDKVVQRTLFFKIHTVVPRKEKSMRTHRNLVKALCADNPDMAEAAMRKHLRAGRESIFKKENVNKREERLKRQVKQAKDVKSQ